MLADFRDALTRMKGQDPVHITGTVLDLVGIGARLKSDLALDALDLSQPDFKLDGTPLIVRGVLSSGPLQGASLSLSAKEDSGSTRVDLALDMPEGWKLSSMLQPANPAVGTLLDSLVLQKTTLTASYGESPATADVHVASSLAIDGALGVLKRVVPDGTKVPFTGSVAQRPGGTEIDLRSSLEVAAPHPLLGATGGTVVLSATPGQAGARFELVVTVAPGGVPVTISCSLPVNGAQPAYLVLEGRFPTPPAGGLAALAERLGFKDIVKALPVRELPPVTLDSFTLCLQVSDGSARGLSVQFVTTAPWSLVPGHFEVPAGASAAVSLDLADRASPRLTLTCDGACSVGGVALPVAFSSLLPEISGAARGDFDIAPLLSSYAPEAAALKLPHLRELAYRVVPGIPALYLRVALAPGYRLTVGPATVVLDDAWIEIGARAGSSLALFARLYGAITVAQARASFSAGVGGVLQAQATIENLEVGTLIRELIGDIGIALPEIEIAFAQLAFDSRGSLTLSADFTVEWTAFLGKLGVTLPQGVPLFAFSTLTFSHDPGGAWRLSLEGHGEGSIGSGANSVRVDSGSIAIAGPGGKGKATLEVAFSLSGTAKPAEGIELADIHLSAAWNSSAGWQVRGGAALTLFGAAHTVIASYDTAKNQMVLGVDGAISLLDFGPSASLVAHDVSFFYGQPPSGEGGTSQPEVGATGALTLEARGLFSATGTLGIALAGGAPLVTLSFHAIRGEVGLPLGLESDPRLVISVPTLEAHVERKAGRFEGAFDADATLAIDRVPTLLKKYLPSGSLSGRITLDAHGASLSFPVPPKLDPPPLHLRWHDHDLGDAGLSISQVTLTVGGADQGDSSGPRLDLTLRAGVPAGVNRLFTKPVFNPGFDLVLRLAKGPQLRLLSSPFASLTLRHDDTDPTRTWWDLDLSPYAAFEVLTPVLAYSNGQWSGTGGFVRRGPVRLPLFPLKLALEALGVPRVVAAHLPNDIELQELDLDSPGFEKDLLALFSDQMLGQLDPGVAAFVREALTKILQGLHRLPQDFRDYLHFKLPTRLTASFIAGTGGQTGIDVSTDPAEPLKLLLPTMTVFGPALLGITFSRLAVSQIAAGTLLIIEFNGHIDQFDLPMLAGALVTDGTTLRNRIVLENVLAVAPTQAPIALPIFYDRIGYDLNSITGLKVTSGVRYKKPTPTILGLLTLFNRLLDFFSKPDYLLHDPAHRLPPDLQLNFVLDTNLITLPPYLGGASIGLENPFPVSIDTCLAYLLDTAKTKNLGYLIRAIPLRQQVGGRTEWYRIGSVTTHFGPLRASTAWCITTEEEFRRDILPNPQATALLARSHLEDAVDSLPASSRGASLDRGFIILLLGSVGVEGLGDLVVQFGIAVTAGGGFETGIRIRFGDPAGLHLDVGGTLQVARQEPAGSVCTTVCGHAVLHGFSGRTLIGVPQAVIAVSSSELHVEATLQLGAACTLGGGWTIAPGGVALTGTFSWACGPGSASVSVPEIAARFIRSGIDIDVSATIFGNDCDVMVDIPWANGQLDARVRFSVGQPLQSLVDGALKSIGNEIGKEIDTVRTDLKKWVGAYEIEFSLRGMRSVALAFCAFSDKSIQAFVDDAIDRFIDTSGIPGLLGATARIAKAAAAPQIASVNAGRKVLGKALKQTDPERVRAALKAALAEIPRYQHIEVGVGPLTFKHDFFSPDQLKTIKAAIAALDDLPATSGKKVKAQQAVDAVLARKAIVDAINRDVAAIPRLEHFEMETDLGPITSSRVSVAAQVSYKGASYRVPLVVDLNNLAGSVGDVIRGFLTQVRAS